MTLGHEKLDVYRLAIGCVAWVYEAESARLSWIAGRPCLVDWAEEVIA